MNAAEHLEHYLGEIDRGWSAELTPGIQFCLFKDRPVVGACTIATLGLSNQVLSLKTDKKVRQELLFAFEGSHPAEPFATLLRDVARSISVTGSALLRGQVIDLASRVTAGSEADSLYVSMPVVFPDGIDTLRDSSPATVFVWLLPLLPDESAFVRERGWGVFEDVLEGGDFDLLDVERASVFA